MAANFNIVLFTKSVIDLHWLLGLVQKRGYNANINQIESIDNWEFDDLKTHSHEEDTTGIQELLEESRIILIRGEVNSNKFVVILNKNEAIYETTVSLDTKFIDYLDSNTLNGSTKLIYDEVSNILLSSEMVDNLLVSALGVEVIVDYDDDFNKMYLDSYNVVRWVFGTLETTGKRYLNGYIQVAADIWDKET